MFINHGAGRPPSIGTYLLGPLPTTLSSLTLEAAGLALEPLKHIYHQPVVPYTARMPSLNQDLHVKFVQDMLGPLNDATLDLFGGTAIPGISGSEPDLLLGWTTPLSYDGSWRRVWMQLRKNGPGSFLRALDMYCETFWSYISKIWLI